MEKVKEKNESSNIFVETILEYIRYWKWILISIIICLSIGFIVIFVSKREYKSSTSILLNQDNKSPNPNDLVDISTGGLSVTNNLQNEIALLSSPNLICNVVDTLNLQTTYYIQKRLKKIEIYSSSPFFVKVNKKDDIGFFDFYIKKNGSKFDIAGVYTNPDREEIPIDIKGQTLPIPEMVISDSIKLNIQLTGNEILDSEKYYVEINSVGRASSIVGSNLSVNNSRRNSTILDIELITYNTEKGAFILNELVKQYNIANVKTNNEIAYNTSRFIDERLKEISAELGSAESDLVSFKQRNKIADLDIESTQYVAQSGINEQKLLEIETQLNVISFIERFVNDPANKFKLIPNIGISDVALTQIITEYNTKLLTYDQLIKNTGDDNPSKIRLTEEINNMRSSISGSLKNVKQAFNVAKQDLQRQSRSTMLRTQSIPEQQQGLLEKARLQQIKETLYLFLMQKREETNLSIAATADKAQVIVSPDQKGRLVAPKSTNILLIAFTLGFIIPILLLYIADLFRVNIKNRHEVEKLSTVSIIGQISKNRAKDKIVIQSGVVTGIAEMFRSLRNNLNFIFKNKSNQIILVTSSAPNEGKTFLSVNLGMSYALTGKKVLLVGIDIRSPELENYVELRGQKGLTNYLIDENNNWQSYINPTQLNPNLEVMIAGAIPPNPNELLMSPRLEQFLSEAKTHYDIIILDSAPVGLVSDAYLLNDFVDITLYVVRENKTPRASVHFINNLKKENRFKNLYLVLNDSVLDNSYKYGYGREYGRK